MESKTIRGRANAGRSRLCYFVGCVAMLVGASPAYGADEEDASSPPSRFTDPDTQLWLGVR